MVECTIIKNGMAIRFSNVFCEECFGMDVNSKLGGSIHFFLYDVVKIFILLSTLIFIISYIQSFFPPERTRKILGRFKGVSGNILGALLGTITPFCSCSSIPLLLVLQMQVYP